jgi:hypothetical protein
MADEKMIKIQFKLTGKRGPGFESVWALDLGDNRAELANIPFFSERASLHDIVRFETDNEGINRFKRLLKRKTVKGYVQYELGSDAQRSFSDLVDHFHSYGIRVEGAMAGFAALAWPIDMDEGKLEESFGSFDKLIRNS